MLQKCFGLASPLCHKRKLDSFATTPQEFSLTKIIKSPTTDICKKSNGRVFMGVFRTVAKYEKEQRIHGIFTDATSNCLKPCPRFRCIWSILHLWNSIIRLVAWDIQLIFSQHKNCNLQIKNLKHYIDYGVKHLSRRNLHPLSYGQFKKVKKKLHCVRPTI